MTSPAETTQRAIPTIRLDTSVAEYADLWRAYSTVSPSARSEWVRLTLIAGLLARRRADAATAAATAPGGVGLPDQITNEGVKS